MLCAVESLVDLGATLLILALLASMHTPEQRALLNAVMALPALLKLPSMVLFAVWLAVSTSHARKAANTVYGPGWAIGCWFVPFANLVWPVQMMMELDEVGHVPRGLQVPRGLYGAWWGSRILAGLVTWVATMTVRGDPTGSLSWSMLAQCIYCASAIALAWIVWRISDGLAQLRIEPESRVAAFR